MIHFSRFSVSTNSIKLKVDKVGKKHLCSKYFIIQYSYMQTCWIVKLLALSYTLVELFPASYRAILSSSSWPLLNCWLLKAEDTLRGTEAPRMMSIDTAGCQKPSNGWRHQSRWLERWEWGTYVLRINQAQSALTKQRALWKAEKMKQVPTHSDVQKDSHQNPLLFCQISNPIAASQLSNFMAQYQSASHHLPGLFHLQNH